MADVDFHPLAIEEARTARRRYARLSTALAGRFVTALDAAVARIPADPGVLPVYLHGTRFSRLRRFPYLLVCVDETTRARVPAVAHVRRRPGYWRRPLRPPGPPPAPPAGP